MSDTRTVIDEFFRRVGNGDIAGLGEFFAETVDLNVYGAEEVPWTGRRTTKAEAVAFFKTLPEYLQPQEFSVAKVFIDGEDAVVLGRMVQKVKPTGLLFDSPFAFHFTVVDGKITRYIAYEDSLALARSFGVG
ncbi:nuclear transport factor 2 family protein [Streptomyces orinoci]|uniref:Nuclear transport factor 2 family protein n=1 Tax=Streptomyces orinoci TaxID=67339 RepID=A0ABV3K2U0_STRON|nr:nuclear transport factor 2 family protein [Streptomyces orinoci]